MDAGAPRQWAYTFVRLVHLVLTTALIPVGLWFVLGRIASPDLFVLGLIWLLSVFTLLFALPMDQSRYPIGLFGAVMRTGPMVVNVAAAIVLQNDLMAGAYFGATAIVAGLALLLTVGAIRELARRPPYPAGEKEAIRDKTTKWVLIPFAGLAWLATVWTVPILMDVLGGRENPYLTPEMGFWTLQAISTSHFWFGPSAWGDPKEDARSDLFSESWGGATAAFFAAALLAVTVVALWRGTGKGG